MASARTSRRRELDFMKLCSEERFVVHTSDIAYDFWVEFIPPEDSLYAGGMYTLHVALPEGYPFKSPSVGFANRIYHPNVDERSGSVCLDVINQTWTPMYDLANVFDTFFPQLLQYPNPGDPLNVECARLLKSDPQRYECVVREHVRRYATLAEAKKGLLAGGATNINPRSKLYKLSLDYENSSGEKKPSGSPNTVLAAKVAPSPEREATEDQNYEPADIII